MLDLSNNNLEKKEKSQIKKKEKEEHKCIHYIVDDYIDIDCDKSMPIKYCIYCFETF